MNTYNPFIEVKTRKSLQELIDELDLEIKELELKEIPLATTDTVGGIKIGSLFKLNSSNQLTTNDPSNSKSGILKGKCEGTVESNYNANEYCVSRVWYDISGIRFKVAIPRATDSALGVVKVGTGLSVDSNGKLNSSAFDRVDIEIPVSNKTASEIWNDLSTVITSNEVAINTAITTALGIESYDWAQYVQDTDFAFLTIVITFIGSDDKPVRVPGLLFAKCTTGYAKVQLQCMNALYDIYED